MNVETARWVIKLWKQLSKIIVLVLLVYWETEWVGKSSTAFKMPAEGVVSFRSLGLTG